MHLAIGIARNSFLVKIYQLMIDFKVLRPSHAACSILGVSRGALKSGQGAPSCRFFLRASGAGACLSLEFCWVLPPLTVAAVPVSLVSARAGSALYALFLIDGGAGRLGCVIAGTIILMTVHCTAASSPPFLTPRSAQSSSPGASLPASRHGSGGHCCFRRAWWQPHQAEGRGNPCSPRWRRR